MRLRSSYQSHFTRGATVRYNTTLVARQLQKVIRRKALQLNFEELLPALGPVRIEVHSDSFIIGSL